MKTLIIGSGVGLRTHLPALLSFIDEKDIGILSRNSGNAKVFTNSSLGFYGQDLSKSISQWSPKLVIVALPPWLHIPVAYELAQSKAHILFEKPVGITSVQCSMISASLSKHTVIVNFQLRGLPAFIEMRELIRREIGDVHLIQITEQSSAYLNRSNNDWKFQPSQGGGQSLSMLTHLLDLVQFFLGFEISDPAVSVLHNESSHHSVAFSCSYKKTMIQIASSSFSFGPRSLNIDILGSNGTIKFSFLDGDGRCYYFSENKKETIWNINESEQSLFRIAMPYYMKNILTFHNLLPIKHEYLVKEDLLATIKDAQSVHKVLETNKINI